MNELKVKIDQTEKKAVEQRAVDEKKHAEEIQFLKKTTQQLKVSLPVDAFNIIIIVIITVIIIVLVIIIIII